MDGLDTVREMRNLDGEEYKKMPIIALSANTVETSREEILTSGFNDVIVKPIELDQAESMLRTYISEDKIKERDTELSQSDDDINYMEDAVLLGRFVSVEDSVKAMVEASEPLTHLSEITGMSTGKRYSSSENI